MGRQTLITNWFDPAHGIARLNTPIANPRTLEANPPAAYVRRHMRITADDDQTNYVCRIPHAHANLGELELYTDNNSAVWINNIQVIAGARRNGVARRLVERAIADHGQVYASNSPHDDHGTRELSADGFGLVMGLIAANVMQQGWYKFPVA
ncbi:MAG: hypothetical protein KDE08_03400 [Rhodobacteraceae bacterium]|nr:hypothetical protein [Paracoccaceae bacterium]